MTERLIDEYMPLFDVAVTEHLVVDAEPARTFAAARELDFMTVRSPLVSAAFFVRSVPARLGHRPAPAPSELHLAAESMDLPGWVHLGEVPGSEICFGAVGRFWQPDIDWHDVPKDRFAAFDEPGWGKVACQFLVRPDGAGRSVLTYECRTTTTDPAARRQMGRYWTVIRPFVGHVLRATLRTIERNARTGTLIGASSGSSGDGRRG